MTDGSKKLNQYTSFDGYGMTYDLNGNMNAQAGLSYTYNYRNQMVSVSENGSTTRYKYDVLGRRIEKSAGTEATKYFFGNGIDEVLRLDNYNADGTAIENSYFYHTNGIGSITAITNSDGEIIERYSYGLYGLPVIKNSSDQVVTSSTIDNEYMFQGRRFEKESGLYYYRARHLDPILGRFLSHDSLGYHDSMNLYQGMNSNPINYLDPMGEFKLNVNMIATRVDTSIGYNTGNIKWDTNFIFTFNTLSNSLVKAGFKTAFSWASGKGIVSLGSKLLKLAKLKLAAQKIGAASLEVISDADTLKTFLKSFLEIESSNIDLPFKKGTDLLSLEKWEEFAKIINYERQTDKIIEEKLEEWRTNSGNKSEALDLENFSQFFNYVLTSDDVSSEIKYKVRKLYDLNSLAYDSFKIWDSKGIRNNINNGSFKSAYSIASRTKKMLNILMNGIHPDYYKEWDLTTTLEEIYRRTRNKEVRKYKNMLLE